MNRFIATMSIVAALCGACATHPTVYDSAQRFGEPPRGRIDPLAQTLPDGTEAIRLIFVHGVGDHCRGYAFDETTGWLRRGNLEALGMRRTDAPPRYERFPASTFVRGAAVGDASYVEYQSQGYTIDLPSRPGLPVEAIEITWSHLTQWIKATQLGYDARSVTPHPGQAAEPCVDPSRADTTDPVAPPPRVLVNKTIKEKVFDRNLVDAILYGGTYGPTIERGVAQALCRALAGTIDGGLCRWPTAPETRRYANVIVTHSLGSRIVYDIVVDALGTVRPSHVNAVDDMGDPAFMRGFLDRTASSFMMANQLSMLGLSQMPASANPDDGPHNFRFDPRRGLDEPATAASTDILSLLVDATRRSTLRRSGTTFQIVAFNDTDDLLTWSIPPWYGRKDAASGGADVNIVNVFVANATRWLGLFVDPLKAHDDYFVSPDVWHAIRCGTDGSGGIARC